MTTTTAALSPSRLRSSHACVLVIFALAGIAFASWASRIADAKTELHLSPGALGATLLFASAGSLLALPSSGRLAKKVGAAQTIRIGMTLSLLGMGGIGVGVNVAHSRWVVAGGLFLVGMGVGVWDVAMNLEGATVERLLGRTTMPHYHAAFSGGTVLSAFIGAGLSWGRVPILVHLLATAVAVLLVGQWQLRHFLPRDLEANPTVEGEQPASATPRRSAWLERRTLLIGAVTLAAAFTEGTANDWLSVAFVEGHHVPHWAGVLAFATFLTFMTIGRILGTRMLDGYGRVPVLRATFTLAVVGALIVVFGPTWLAYAGAAVWGIGASLGFPVGMSASADDPVRAAARMSTVATIGYAAFIAGPPLLGFLGDHFGVLRSLLVVGGMLGLAILVVPAVREPEHAS
ncbi:MAG: MFS transporter [Nostocoides sp.]